MFMVDTILESVNKVVDKIFPDANVREQVKAQLATEALEWYKLELADKDSARKREIATQDPTTRQLAWLYTLGYFGILVGILGGYVVVTEQLRGLIEVLMGVLTAGQYSVMSYYFGSSHGSASKDSTIGSIVKNGHDSGKV